MCSRYAPLMVPHPITRTRIRTITRAPPDGQANLLDSGGTAADLATKMAQLMTAVEPEGTPLELTTYNVRGEPVTFAEAARGDYRPFQVGDRWGPPWSTTWFHVRGRVPAEWVGKSVVAVFDLGFQGHTGFTCEALAWRDGKPWRGVDPNHRWLPIESTEVDFYLEASAIPTAVVAGPAAAPSMIALREALDPAFVSRQAGLRVQDPSARTLALDFKVLDELALALPEGDRRAEILEALRRFAHSDDPEDLAGMFSRPRSE